MPATIKAKKRCCKSGPRCKKCPVVCTRLERAGYLERSSKRVWTVIDPVPKKALRVARARP